MIKEAESIGVNWDIAAATSLFATMASVAASATRWSYEVAHAEQIARWDEAERDARTVAMYRANCRAEAETRRHQRAVAAWRTQMNAAAMRDGSTVR